MGEKVCHVKIIMMFTQSKGSIKAVASDMSASEMATVCIVGGDKETQRTEFFALKHTAHGQGWTIVNET